MIEAKAQRQNPARPYPGGHSTALGRRLRAYSRNDPAYPPRPAEVSTEKWAGHSNKARSVYDPFKGEPLRPGAGSIRGGFRDSNRGIMADPLLNMQKTEALRARLAQTLKSRQYERSARAQCNPFDETADYLARQIDGGAISLDAVESLLEYLTGRSFEFRARRLSAYFGGSDTARDEAAIRDLLRRLSQTAENKIVPFEQFSALVERNILGLVITGHPTFGMSAELTALLAEIGLEGQKAPITDEARITLRARVAALPHGPPSPLDLATERAYAAIALVNIQSAINKLYRIVLEVAAERFPRRWAELTPGLVTIASWLGYDTDGRSDIHWNDIMAARLEDGAGQLDQYRKSLEAVCARLDQNPSSAQLRLTLQRLRDSLEALERSMRQCRRLVPRTPDNIEQTIQFNRNLVQAPDGERLKPDRLVKVLSDAIDQCERADCRLALATLRAEAANYGTVGAHMHIRVNAIQMTNAIRKEIGIESTPDHATDRRRYLRKLNELLDTVEPVSVNFGSVLAEQMSARRVFMVLAELVKHVDPLTPIRFLIAESDTTFTVLSALYFARLFGIEDHIDISPLFETSAGLEHGHEIVDELLRNDHFRTYVCARGRFCIETGFSDGGRYFGQVAASLAIERLRIKIAKVLARHGLQDKVGLVVFDTHGESIGRGAHPVSFQDRLDYVYTPASRQAFANAHIAATHEVSFQGGDGYVYFASPQLAFATVARLICHALASEVDFQPGAEIGEHDLFYADTDYSLDYFLTIKSFNENLIADPGYIALLQGLGRNLLYRTGSRRIRRESVGIPSAQERRLRMRAIPHNGVLQQLGYLANSTGGLGTAIAKDRDRFAEILAGSPRCRSIMSLAAYAYTLSSPDAFAAYVGLFDSATWLARATAEADEDRRRQFQRVARSIAVTDWHAGPSRITQVLLDDAIDFRATMNTLTEFGLVSEVAKAAHPDLDLLHAVRLALIQLLYLHAARLPRFTPHEDVTIEQVLEQILLLDVPTAVATLKDSFPIGEQPTDPNAFGEPASYMATGARNYADEHRELFDPMLRLYSMIQRVSVCISHVMGAVG